MSQETGQSFKNKFYLFKNSQVKEVFKMFQLLGKTVITATNTRMLKGTEYQGGVPRTEPLMLSAVKLPYE